MALPVAAIALAIGRFAARRAIVRMAARRIARRRLVRQLAIERAAAQGGAAPGFQRGQSERQQIGLKVRMSGPVVDGQGGAMIRNAVKRAERDLALKGVERLNLVLRPRPAGVYKSATQAGKNVSRGNYRRHVKAVMKNKQTLITDSGVVYGAWLEGVSGRNAASKFKGYASFRRTGTWLNKQAPVILRHHIKKLTQELNGGST